MVDQRGRFIDSYTDLKEEGYHGNAILSEVIKLSSDIPQANFAVDDVHLQGEPPTLHGVLWASVVVCPPVEVELDGPVVSPEVPATEDAPPSLGLLENMITWWQWCLCSLT